MPRPQPDTSTAVAARGVATSSRGIEAHSVLTERPAVKPERGRAATEATCRGPSSPLLFCVPMAGATANVTPLEAIISFAKFGLLRSS